MYHLPAKTVNGKEAFVFYRNPNDLRLTSDKITDKILVPCGNCEGCRIDRSRSWAARLVNEAQTFSDKACFVTLTFDDQKYDMSYAVDEYGEIRPTLVKRDFQLFMKRLRKAYPQKLRYFACGEYGSLYGRPHFHAILFGVDFTDDPDKELIRYSKKYNTFLYTSKSLYDIWSYGNVSVGKFSFASGAYVARYCMKKIDSDLISNDDFRYYKDGRLAPFLLQSTRPGIGAFYFEQFKDSIYSVDRLIVDSHTKIKVPRYYDKLLERSDPERYAAVKAARIQYATSHVFDGFDSNRNPTERLFVKRDCKRLQIAKLIRPLEV